MKKELTVVEILNTIKEIPYYNNVVEDYDAGDFSWEVTEKVMNYANRLLLHPEEVKNFPPIIVRDGKLKDGAHRISTVYLLQKRLDATNNFWNTIKLQIKEL